MIKTQIHYEGKVIPFYTAHEQHLFRYIQRSHTFYELELLEYIRDNLPNGSTAIDIGGNCGNHALYFAMHYPETHVFEANPLFKPILHKNLLEFDEHVHIYCPYALGAGVGWGSMAYPDGVESDHTGELRADGGDIPILTLMV